MQVKLALAASIIALMGAVPAEAVDYAFTLWSDDGAEAGYWRAPSNPVPDFSFANGFELWNVPGYYHTDITGYLDFIQFRRYDDSLGSILLEGAGFFYMEGPPVFEGPTDAPVFLPGTYAMISEQQFAYTLRIAAVPEPASWAMMIGGFGLAGMAVRRRRKAEAAA